MAKKESVLTDAEKASFEIEKFIFHIIMEDKLQPIYLDEVELDDDQIEFFKERFKDVSEGVQHEFIDRSKSDVYKHCSELVKNPDKNFVTISQELAYQFKNLHHKAMKDGVFIVSVVKVAGSRRLVFLLKVDHRKVYEYKVKGRKALLKEITDTFIEDKKAIQKSALIDVTDHYSWDVLAIDRTATGKLAIRDYFARFLHVKESMTNKTLTNKAVSAARIWAMSNKDSLGLSFDISHYKTKAIAYLTGTSRYKTRDFIKAIIADEPDDQQDILTKSLKKFIR